MPVTGWAPHLPPERIALFLECLLLVPWPGVTWDFRDGQKRRGDTQGRVNTTGHFYWFSKFSPQGLPG